MAEVAVTSTINMLAPLLINEAKSLRRIHKEVTSIKDELESLRSFLKDVDSRAATGSEGEKCWVKQVREVTYWIEDVMDEYRRHLAKRRQRHGFASFLRRAAHPLIKLKLRYMIVSQIQDIKQAIHEIKRRADTYQFSSLELGLSNTEEIMPHDPRMASLYIKEGEVVGIQSARDELIDRLTAECPNRTVMAIVGMPGVGKTTLPFIFS